MTQTQRRLPSLPTASGINTGRRMKVWDNTVASLRQVPVMTSDTAGRHACALRYGTFLLQVDQHLPGGFDHSVLQWFLGPGENEVVALSTDAWMS
jgi:mediator of RNA polymerase II transcription subunit 12